MNTGRFDMLHDTHDMHVLPKARGIVRAIERDRRVSYLPWFWRPIMLVVRWLPESIFQRFDFLAGR